jgi:hypothetical protein
MNPAASGIRSLRYRRPAVRARLDLAISRYNSCLTHFLNVGDNERQIYEIHEKYTDAQMALYGVLRLAGGGIGRMRVIRQVRVRRVLRGRQNHGGGAHPSRAEPVSRRSEPY